ERGSRGAAGRAGPWARITTSDRLAPATAARRKRCILMSPLGSRQGWAPVAACGRGQSRSGRLHPARPRRPWCRRRAGGGRGRRRGVVIDGRGAAAAPARGGPARGAAPPTRRAPVAPTVPVGQAAPRTKYEVQRTKEDRPRSLSGFVLCTSYFVLRRRPEM